jgi:Abortive infection alpha
MTEPGRSPPDRVGDGIDALVGAVGAVTRGMRGAFRALPGVGPVEAKAEAGERFVRTQITQRLEGPEPARVAPSSLLETTAAARTSPRASPERRLPIDEAVRALLATSMRTTPEESRVILYEALVGELVPDEARILSALSDGSTYAMLHILEPGFGVSQKRVLENASSVGRAAGVALPEYVHLYVSHLRRLGLVEPGPEDHSLKDEYDILLTEPKLRATIASIGNGPLGARVIRRTVRISDLGRELWEAAHPPGGVNGDPVDSRAS